MANGVIAGDMLGIEIKAPGGPEMLQISRFPVPTPGPEDVLIETVAAGVNRPDCLQRLGLYPPPKGASPIPGLEISGHIVGLGERVSGFEIGDPVLALLTGGGYAQYGVCDYRCVLPAPSALSLTDAAGIPETFFTVWHNVIERASFVRGETVLVHGGSSGIGTTAIQIIKHLGGTVIVTAGSDEKCKACLELGADHAINYREHDFVAQVNEITHGHGVDIILDMVGGDYLARNIQAAGMDGRIVQIAFLQGSKIQAEFMPLMLKRLTYTGSTLRARDVVFKGNLANQLREILWPAIESGNIKPVVTQKFTLEDASRAHALMESGDLVGKIVLEVAKEK